MSSLASSLTTLPLPKFWGAQILFLNKILNNIDDDIKIRENKRKIELKIILFNVYDDHCDVSDENHTFYK